MLNRENHMEEIDDEISPNHDGDIDGPQDQPSVDSEPRPRLRNNRTVRIAVASILVAMVIVVASLFVFVTYDPMVEDNSPEGCTYEMIDLTTMEILENEVRSGKPAQGLREIIDGEGNADGIVTRSEVRGVEEDVEMWRLVGFNHRISWAYRDLWYSHYEVSISGATGFVSSEEPIRVRISATGHGPQDAVGMGGHIIVITPICRYTMPNFKFTSVPGYFIHETWGLSTEEYDETRAVVEGYTQYGARIYMVEVGRTIATGQEPNHDFDSALPVSDGNVVFGFAYSSFPNYYKIDLISGDTVEIASMTSPWASFGLSMYDSDQKLVYWSENRGGYELISYHAQSNGTYYFRIGARGYSYTLSIDVS